MRIVIQNVRALCTIEHKIRSFLFDFAMRTILKHCCIIIMRYHHSIIARWISKLAKQFHAHVPTMSVYVDADFSEKSMLLLRNWWMDLCSLDLIIRILIGCRDFMTRPQIRANSSIYLLLFFCIFWSFHFCHKIRMKRHLFIGSHKAKHMSKLSYERCNFRIMIYCTVNMGPHIVKYGFTPKPYCWLQDKYI